MLKGNGRLLVIVPNRRGLWSRVERTPFGHGQPYSVSQLSRVLRNNMFTASHVSRALFVPPYRWRAILRSGYSLEDLGSRWLKLSASVAEEPAALIAMSPLMFSMLRSDGSGGKGWQRALRRIGGKGCGGRFIPSWRSSCADICIASCVSICLP